MRGGVADTCVKKLPPLRYIYVWTHGYICHFTQTRYNVSPTSEWEVSASQEVGGKVAVSGGATEQEPEGDASATSIAERAS